MKVSIDELAILYHYIIDNSPNPGILLDVGAHYGESAIPFLSQNWQVFSFEPDGQNRKILRENTKEFKNLKIFDFALSDTDAENIPFYASSESTGISSLLNFHPTHEVSSSVSTKRLDTFCRHNNISKIDFLKIDTEGYDYKILSSFNFDELKPSYILCEFDFNKTDDFNLITDLLVKHDYDLVISEWDPIDKYGQEHSWNSFKKWPAKLSNNKSWGNILASNQSFDLLKLCNAAIQSTGKAKIPSPTQDRYETAIKNYLLLKLKSLVQAGINKIYLFGAGKFTQHLIELFDQDGLPNILAVLDDNAKEINYIKKYSVKKPDTVNFDLADAVILSTDTHQETMTIRCKELSTTTLIIDLFEKEL